MTRKTVAAGLAVLGLVSLGTPARSAITSLAGLNAQQGQRDPAGDPAQQPPFLTPADQPQLKSNDQQSAEGIVARDEALKKLLGSTDYTVAESGPWTESAGLAPLGAALELRLSEPATLSGDWPKIVYDDKEKTDPPYKKTTANFSAAGVTSLSVLVDLKRHQLVSVVPDPDAKITLGPDEKPTPPPTDED